MERQYYAITDGTTDARRVEMSYCLETGTLVVKTPVLRFSSGFRHVGTSAPLPPCALDGPAKFCPLRREWIARSEADPSPAAVKQQYDHAPWPWWG